MLGERIGLRSRVVSHAALLQELGELVRHTNDDATDFFIVGWRERVEADRRASRNRVDAVEGERVDVAVQIDCGSKALQETDRSALRATDHALPARPTAQGREERSQKDVQYLTHQLCVVGTAVTEWIRKRQHPLSHRDLGQDPIHEVRGGIRHAPSAAGGTESPFAREGQKTIEPAGVAVQAQEALCQHSAFEVSAKLAFHEVRDWMIATPGACEKGLEVLAHRLVQQRLFWAAGRCTEWGMRRLREIGTYRI